MVTAQEEMDMGKLDALTKKYLSQDEVFADAFNYLIFDGKPVIDPRELKEQDPTEIAVIRKLGRVFTDQKMRDILKSCTIRHSRYATLVLLGIEGQANIHYAMPVKDYLYDALNYAAQVENARRMHQENADIKTGAEFLSGFTREDHLIPVITLCICFDKEKWDAPRSLYEMFGNIDPQIRKYVDDYQLNLITPADIDNFDKFASELGIVLEFIKNSEDKQRIHDIINTNERYQHVDISSVDMINAYTSANISKAEAEGGQVNMCTAIKELMEDSRAEGIEEGVTKGEDMLADLILKLTPGSKDYMKALQGTTADRKRLYRKYGIIKYNFHNR